MRGGKVIVDQFDGISSMRIETPRELKRVFVEVLNQADSESGGVPYEV